MSNDRPRVHASLLLTVKAFTVSCAADKLETNHLNGHWTI